MQALPSHPCFFPIRPPDTDQFFSWFCRDASHTHHGALQTLTLMVVTITRAARGSSGKQGKIIAQVKSVKATPDAPSQLRCYWTGAWTLTDWLLSPCHAACPSFLCSHRTMEEKWGSFRVKSTRKTSQKREIVVFVVALKKGKTYKEPAQVEDKTSYSPTNWTFTKQAVYLSQLKCVLVGNPHSQTFF